MTVSSLAFRLLILATFIVPSIAQAINPADCASSVHLLLLRGEGTGDDLNVLDTIQNLVLEQIPGATSLGVPYQHGDSDKQFAAYNGSVLLQQYIAGYATTCPDSKIAVLGYSLGAVATMNAICGVSSLLITHAVEALDFKYASNVIAVVAYGDETYVPLQSWNVGNCTIGAGIYPRLDPGACEPFASSLKSYCDYGDYQCCSILPDDANAAHHTYFTKYNQDVVAFIQSRLG
ncbi:acetylxylan esterase precursor, putative [Talaromyces stipitatus ATCC 10500]|uniref:Acetylxylan esterase, putative n=1 Tax=Talaromyces stipitatus (strain ATCC 10500 / CBS 375.48 / QM 6759 / NRRL 1006) TaxID=441959 RepID=B8LWY3_TALSN|nr:acetylxylan esterase precursor, putative [Talaromyces stipitatus ATCC 10500]EED24616.1 acetylxylan esterase precursor, putative [Talaromyces stipitatus ATCC 10500]